MVGGRKTEIQVSPNENNEDNTEALAKEECVRLSRQLRIMENDKKAYMEESTFAIHQQRKTIANLESEIAKMEDELSKFSSKKNETRDTESLKKIYTVLDKFVELRDKVALEDTLINEMEQRVKVATNVVDKLRLKVEAEEKREDIPLPQLENKDFTLNKKLETVTAQFDSVVAKNAELRKSIDKLLKENVAIMKRYRILETSVKNGKAKIDELVDRASAAYDQREEAVAKMNALLERNSKENKQYVLETGELSRTIRHEEKLLDFMNVKNKERTFLETEDQRASRLEYAKEAVLEEALETYRKSFEQLFTPESPDLTSLVDEYAELQHHNIGRFTYITELNQEAETLTRDINSIRQMIKKHSSETVQKNQAKNAAIMLQLGRLQGKKRNYAQIQKQMSMYKSSMEEIIETMRRLLDITDCVESAPVLELLGNQQELSEKNLILYLNILEHRITELLAFGNEGMHSSRGSPILRSPKPIKKTVSETSLTLKPKIVLAEKSTLGVEDAEEKPGYELVETEEEPLSYTNMRDKILDTTSIRSGSSLSMVDDRNFHQ